METETLGEALFALSDRLRLQTGFFEEKANHDAYERVVAAFRALSPEQPRPTEAGDAGLAAKVMDALWPLLGGNHTDADLWQQISDAVAASLTRPVEDQAVERVGARLAQMDASTGLVRECLERATYLLAMAPEGQSTIERQAMETLFKAADALSSLNSLDKNHD